MDALRRSVALLAAIVVMLCVLPLADQSDADGDANGLLLYEVSPYGDDEGISLFNYGKTAVNLKDYAVTDGEGTLDFTKSISIPAGSSITVVAKKVSGSYFSDRSDVYLYSDCCDNVESKFSLNNSGDDVYLKDSSGNVIDAVYYGNVKNIDSSLWVGSTVSIQKNTFIQRQGTTDTDSSDDWFTFIPGRTNLEFDPNLKFDATVTPFLFPESGGIPVLKTLESATKSIDIEIYMLANTNVYSLLLEKLESGVTVRLLVEGNSVKKNVELTPNLEYMKAIADKGATVRLIGVGGDGVTDRFAYVHAKFAVIDDEKVILTSENWTKTNLNGSIDDNPYKGDDGNRGWGAIVDSKEYAAYMKNVFESDFRTDFKDVKDLETIYKNLQPAKLSAYKSPEDATFESYKAKVTPVLSCDNSSVAVKYYMENAKTRIYSEQQSFQEEYTDLTRSSPFSYMAAKASELDGRLVLSSNCDESLVLTLNQTSMVKTARMTGSTYVHNKGLICDDVAWVSSINWTDNSFKNNRESCVAIESKTVADFFAESFLKDFERFYSYDGISVDLTEIEESYTQGEEITLTVKTTPATGNYSYTWDLGDGSEPRTTTVPRISCTPISSGDGSAYVLTVTVTDLDTGHSSTVTKNYSVVKEGSTVDDIVDTVEENKIAIIPLIIVILLGIVAKMLSGSKKKKKKSSSKKRK